MTVGEVFSKISDRQTTALMMHEEFADYYDFLNLCGFKRMHEYQFFAESAEMRGVHRYYINHYHRLLVPSTPHEHVDVIPSSWESYTRQDVDPSTLQKAVRDGLEKWRTWEMETKTLYQELYGEMQANKEVAGACKVLKLIKGVDQELKRIDRLYLKLKNTDYDLICISSIQDEIHEKYKEKTKNIGIDIC